MSQIKCKYIHLDGDVSTAYIDEETNFGQDKWTEEPVQLRWDGELWVMTGAEQILIKSKPNECECDPCGDENCTCQGKRCEFCKAQDV